MKFIHTFSSHKENPTMPLDRYVKFKKIELGVLLDGKIKIYLDTKYWIYFRDVVLGRSNDVTLVESYEILSLLCDKGLVVCPISEDVFYEVTKQLDKKTLSASIELIDKLSQGVSLLSQTERIQAEILHFFHRYTHDAEELHPLKHLVWTKICYLMGTYHPKNTAFSSEYELVIQKAFFDQMWNITLSELCELIGYDDIVNNIPRMPDYSSFLNTDAEIERSQNQTFKEIFISEIYYMAKYIESDLKEAMEYMAEKGTGNALTKEKKEVANNNNGMATLSRT